MTAALEGSEWSAARLDRTLPPGKTRYPFYRRPGGPQGRSGRVENLVPTGIRSRTVQPVAQSLYRLSYPAHLYNTTYYTKQISLISIDTLNFLLRSGNDHRCLHKYLHGLIFVFMGQCNQTIIVGKNISNESFKEHQTDIACPYTVIGIKFRI